MRRTATTLLIVIALLLCSGCLAHRFSAPQARNSAPLSAGTAARLGIPAQATVIALPGADLHLRDTMPEEFRGVFSRPPYTMRDVDYPRDLSADSIPTGVANLDDALRATPGHPTRRTTGLATPTDTPWHIVDVARRYDGFADSPQDKSNGDAVRNANLGKLFIHPHYEGVDLNDPSLVIWIRGNTTFVLTDEPALPIFQKSGAGPGQADAMRSRIESAYRRE